MNSLETFLTILFVIMVYLVVINKMPTSYIMGAVALWFTILWIGFDNMNLWKSPNTFGDILGGLIGNNHKPHTNQAFSYDHNIHQDCSHSQPMAMQPMAMQPMAMQPMAMQPIDIKKSVDASHQAAKKELKPPPKPRHLKYSEDNYKYNIFDEIGSLGDNMLAHKQKQRGNMNRVAMDNFSRMQTKNSTINYFAQELKDAAGSRWWDNEELEDEF
jgi:hypothetical protein